MCVRINNDTLTRALFETYLRYLCAKLKIYGFEGASFLTGRSQERVRIGKTSSNKLDLESEVPQGSFLYPVTFGDHVNTINYMCVQVKRALLPVPYP